MTKLIFKFDREKDLYNIWETSNTKFHYGLDFRKNLTPNILKICSNKKYKECRNELKKTMNYYHKNPIMKTIVDSFNRAWKKINAEYFKRLEKIMGKKFFCKEITVYLTTAGRCPYDPRPNSPSFYINFSWNIPFALSAAGHELMHLQFHNMDYWGKTEKEIGYDKTHDLKEALTVLLNLEFRDLWISEDKGYPAHQKLRKYMEKEWKKKKDFENLIEKSIKWIKRNGIK